MDAPVKTMTVYDQIVHRMTKAKIPCEVSLGNEDRITVACGWNYPEKLSNRIEDALEDMIIDHKKLHVCADNGGTTITKSVVIAGGPKRYTSKDGRWG